MTSILGMGSNRSSMCSCIVFWSASLKAKYFARDPLNMASSSLFFLAAGLSVGFFKK